jgi:hypothetical protein
MMIVLQRPGVAHPSYIHKSEPLAKRQLTKPPLVLSSLFSNSFSKLHSGDDRMKMNKEQFVEWELARRKENTPRKSISTPL